jgi:hypothetical protein
LETVQVEPAPAAHNHAVGYLDSAGSGGIGHLLQHRTALTLAFFEAYEQHGSGAVLSKRRDHRGNGILNMLRWRQVDSLHQTHTTLVDAVQAHGHEAVMGVET